jgi:hypothetical protein
MVTERSEDLHVIAGFAEWEWLRDSAVVPDWLNAARGTDSYARVTKLLDEIRQVESGMDRAVREGWYISPPSKPKAVVDQITELSQRHNAINEMLSRYSLSPVIQRVLWEKRWMLSMTCPSAPNDFAYPRMVHEGKRRISKGQTQLYSHDERTVGESDVVLRILNLAAASELARVKECEGCSKWFYAERSHQRFCPGSECRLAEYAKSPKYKNYRKLYMRRKRAMEAAERTAKPSKRKGR